MTAIATNPDRSLSPVQVERLAPGPTEVVIKSAAVGINPVDWQNRRNATVGEHDPEILGWDVAGQVVEIGGGVTRFVVGDRVFGMPRFPARANAYAEYVVAGSREVARTPDNVVGSGDNPT